MADELEFDVDWAAAIAGIDATAERLVEAGGRALFEEATAVMGDSQANYVPVDQGVLRASGTVLPPEKDGDDTVVTLGYGGPAQAYATVQHEHTEFKHTVGEDHYLSKPLAIAAGGLTERLAARISDIVGG